MPSLRSGVLRRSCVTFVLLGSWARGPALRRPSLRSGSLALLPPLPRCGEGGGAGSPSAGGDRPPPPPYFGKGSGRRSGGTRPRPEEPGSRAAPLPAILRGGSLPPPLKAGCCKATTPRGSGRSDASRQGTCTAPPLRTRYARPQSGVAGSSPPPLLPPLRCSRICRLEARHGLGARVVVLCDPCLCGTAKPRRRRSAP